MRAHQSIAVDAGTSGPRRIVPGRVIVVSIIWVVAATSTSRALATNGTWTDTTSGGLWSATGNWSGGTVANGTDGIADFSTLNITSDDTVHLDSIRTIGQLKFGDTVPSNNWILDNNGLPTITLTLAVSSGTPTITVNNDTATMNLVLAGTQGFTKSGAGELLLDDANTFTSSVAINAGRLALGNATALGSTSNTVTVNTGATLDLGGQAIGANSLTISGTGVGGNGALINSSATAASYSGTINVSAAVSIGGSGDITLSGSVNSATNMLTKIGNDTLTLGGSTDDSSLAVTVNSGTVILAKASASGVHAIGGGPGLVVNGGTAQLGGTGSDQIYDFAPVTVTSGAFDANGRNETFGTLSLQGTGIGNAGALVNSAAGSSEITPTSGTTLTGNATIGVTQSTGILQLDNPISGAFALTKTGAGTFVPNGTSSFSGGLTIAQGTYYPNQPINNAGTNGELGNNTSVTLGSSGQTGFLELDPKIGTIQSNMPFTLAAGGTGEFLVPVTDNVALGSVTLTGPISGAGALYISGGYSLTLDGNNTFSGGLTVDSATTLYLTGNNAFATGGVAVNNGSTLYLTGNNAFTGGVTVNNGSTLQISGNNTFTGGVTINGGSSVQVGSAGALNASGANAVTFTGTAGTLSLGGFSTTVSGLNSIGPNSATVQNFSATPATLTVNISGATNDSFGGNIQDGSGGGPLSLVKTGSGTLSLLGNNTFTGTTTINGGTLCLTGDGVTTLGEISSTSVVDNAVFQLAIPTVTAVSNFSYPLTANISGTGSLLKSGPGSLTLSGNNTFGGMTTITGGTLILSGGSLSSNILNQTTFEYNGGTFSGRLINQGALVFTAPFVVGNGMENDGTTTITGGIVTLNGAGFDNEGTLTVSGGSFTLSGAANVNRGNLNLSTLNLPGATLTNNGSLVLTGGLVTGASGLLTNGVGGTISGTGNVSSGFSNTGGVVLQSGGTLNITQPFSNSSLIELDGFTANLTGGAISNSGTIQGFGNVGNAATNTGTIEPISGTLALGGTLLNPAGGLIRVGTGGKLLAMQGLLASAGIVNLTGGTFDNGGQPLNNLGQISGFGTFASGGTGLDNNGSITFSGGLTIVNGPVTNENGKTIAVDYDPAIFTGMVTNNSGATFETTSATATFAGGFTNNGATNFVNTAGGMANIIAAPTLNSGSTLSVVSGTVSFDLVSGSPSVGSNVAITVNSGATLQLAGTVSALSNAANPTTNLANVITHGTGTLLVTGPNQSVGTVTGDSSSNDAGATVYTGSTVVGNGSSAAELTAKQILQDTLTINAGSTVTIAPSAGSQGGAITASSSATSSAASSNASADGSSDSDSSSDPFTAIQAAIASGSISSATGQRLENRIAAIEQLAATDPGLDASLLESRVLAALPSSSILPSTNVSTLADTGSGLFAADSSWFGTGTSGLGGTFAPAASFSGSPTAVPEPTTLLLATMAGIGLALATRRRASRQAISIE